MELFYSYFEDNPKLFLLSKNGSQFDRIQPTLLLNAAYRDFSTEETWAVGTRMTKLDSVTFSYPKSARFPGYFENTVANKQCLQFTTEPKTFSSFSIFTWVYSYYTFIDGHLAFGSDPDYRNTAFSFLNGWPGYGGYPYIYIRSGGSNYLHRNTVKWATGSWQYRGVSFNGSSGNIFQ